jgi:Dolichyl-phosphate-mannose-protein mannosyltransferase
MCIGKKLQISVCRQHCVNLISKRQIFSTTILSRMTSSVEQELTSSDTRLGIWESLNPNLIAGLIVGAGFLVRLKLASETFLNADEALHFMAANQPTWSQTCRASLTISHPPLLIFLLHLWRTLGTSELILRLPCVFAGSIFCWFLFKWLSGLLGATTGLIGVLFATFLPPMLALSAEIRQYAFLLCFAMCAAYFLERAFAQNSAGKMLLFSLFLWLAILSHYSAVLIAATLGIYTLLRMFSKRPSRSVIGVWAAGQMLVLAICGVLYFTYISAFGRIAFHSWMDVYLHNSYYHSSHHNPLVFVITRSASFFQYLLGDNAIGIVMFIAFIAGIVMLFKRRPAGSAPVSQAQIATLLVLPFGINCALAFFDVYPYGGTRHCVFLAIFAIAGISWALFSFGGQRLWRGVMAAAVIVAMCHVFPSRRLPYIARADQQRAHMQQALDFIRAQIPANGILFVDNQTSLLLGHYLCQHRPFFINEWTHGFNSLQCGEHQIVGTDGQVFAFTAANFLPSWNEMVRMYNLKPADSVWVVQAGWLWEDPVAEELKDQYPGLNRLDIHSFGHNITIFRLAVPLPIRP